ncbi:MAG: signal peptidase II [Burkholderiaceae bacterium]|nr:signal peptidase II [Burkholderiaceae bacterium]MCD8516732.1 signal peptidase II [Burkholderiaceae bacterium]MCD8536627.1 signal peptidase II [Burkholderiaceae bacterium]MCD8564432.1 signal peptidase II [Burkholderiaceae bacterium]
MRKWLGLAVILVVVDQITKLVAQSTMRFGERIHVLPVFDFTLVYNRGAAFSFLAQGDGWQRWFLSGIAVAAIVFILWLMKTQAHDSRRMMLALTLILSGAIGNLIDRLFYGHVVDFLLVYWHPWYYPAFNIADTAITLGAILLIWDEWQRWRQSRRTSQSTSK